jgi:hypothetical protein
MFGNNFVMEPGNEWVFSAMVKRTNGQWSLGLG